MKLSKYVNSTKIGNDYLLFHSQIGNACCVDSKIYEILNHIDKNLYENEIIDEFVAKQFLVETDEDTIAIDKQKFMKNLSTGSQIKTIQLVVSNNCNFKCKYCFENKIYCSPQRERDQNDVDNKVMNPDQAVKYVDTIISYLKEKNNNVQLHIQFFGGEPLTNKEAIKKVLDEFGDGTNRNVFLSYSIVTNGSLIDEEIASYFSKYGVSVIVSFDNPKQKDRDMKSGEDSVERTFEILDILKKKNVYTAFNSVLSSFTYSYFDTDIIDCALEHNVKEVGIVMDLDPDFYSKYHTDDIAEKVIRLVTYGNEKDVLVSGYWMSTYLGMMENKEYQKGFKTCSGTGSQFSIEPNGNIYACKGSSGFFGNVNNIKELLSSKNYGAYATRSLRNSEKCKGCMLEGFCSGFCLGPLEQTYSDIEYVVVPYCEVLKNIARKLLKQEGNLDYYEYQ